MYQQPNHSYQSSDSLRRLSANNPFRQNNFEPPRHINRSASSLGSGHSTSQNQAFEDWVEKNKQLIEDSDDEDIYSLPKPVDMNLNMNVTGEASRPVHYNNYSDLPRPSFPNTVRAGSDSSVNYSDNRYVYLAIVGLLTMYLVFVQRYSLIVCSCMSSFDSYTAAPF